jgi:hypothetical protein
MYFYDAVYFTINLVSIRCSHFSGPIKIPITPVTARPCDPSETLVTGRTSVCKGEVVFEDHFNTPLSSVWNHAVMIPDDPVGLN